MTDESSVRDALVAALGRRYDVKDGDPSCLAVVVTVAGVRAVQRVRVTPCVEEEGRMAQIEVAARLPGAACASPRALLVLNATMAAGAIGKRGDEFLLSVRLPRATPMDDVIEVIELVAHECARLALRPPVDPRAAAALHTFYCAD